MATKYLVTGGSGFLGAACVRRLVKDGHKVRVLDNNSRGRMRRLDDVIDDIEVIEGDVRNAAIVDSAVAGTEEVLHLAFLNGTEFFYKYPELVLDIGIRGMLNVLDACRARGVGRLCLASSSETYQQPPVVPTPEDVPLVVPDVLNPRYSYGGGKLISELMALNWGRTGFDRVTVFRPHNIYGPDMGWEHVIPQFCLRAIDLIAANPSGPLSFDIKGGGDQTRAFCHVDDFVDGVAALLRNGAHMNVYHIGNPEELTIAALAKKVVGYFGREIALRSTESFKGETSRRSPDIAKLRGLGYSPHISLDEGLRGTLDWYAGHLDLRNDRLHVA
ncbi:MAG TPA: NAD-dependent epimerase/dehydratase family protein [Rhizomicrobium sp.]|nr:NAD-dependent epimerase/dehydratase family protein [Rhizomicrobium sp.]